MKENNYQAMAFRCFPSMDEREEYFARYMFEGDP